MEAASADGAEEEFERAAAEPVPEVRVQNSLINFDETPIIGGVKDSITEPVQFL